MGGLNFYQNKCSTEASIMAYMKDSSSIDDWNERRDRVLQSVVKNDPGRTPKVLKLLDTSGLIKKCKFVEINKLKQTYK